MRINRTTKRTIDILELISKHKKGLTLKEIMHIIDIPQTSAFDILQTLLSANMIEERYDEYKRYSIGIKAYEIGMTYSYHTDIIQTAASYMEELAEHLGKTSFLGILDHNQISYIYKYEPANAIITTAKIGSRNEVYCTSLGKAILAFMEKEEQEKLIKTIEFSPKTSKTIRNKKDLIKDLQDVKLKGYALDDRELEEHIFCIGAPVFDYTNQAIAAVSATGLYKPETDLAVEAEAVVTCALRISERLGSTMSFASKK